MTQPDEFIQRVVQQATQMQQDGALRHKILAHLTTAAETIAGDDSVSSILILDKNGLLRDGASPRLPNDYLAAIDGLRPDPNVGTCAAAAATGSIVITTDFQADDKWAELRHLPMALGFRGAWSMPIKDNHGKVLGTFGTYFRSTRKPSQAEINAVEQLVNVAARILN